MPAAGRSSATSRLAAPLRRIGSGWIRSSVTARLVCRRLCRAAGRPNTATGAILFTTRLIPRSKVCSRCVFCRLLSKFVKARLNFRGYFDLYNMPFKYLPLFDFTEKRNPLQAGGMNRGANIFDFLELRDIPYHVSDPTRRETENLAS